MRSIKLFLVLLCIGGYAQNPQKQPLKFKGQIKGVFEIIAVDSIYDGFLFRANLKYLLDDFTDHEKLFYEIPKEYQVLIFSVNPTKRQIRQNISYSSLKIGNEYFFDLKHYFYYMNLNPPPNVAPYQFRDKDDKIIWKEEDDLGIYTTHYLEGNRLVIDKYVKDEYNYLGN